MRTCCHVFTAGTINNQINSMNATCVWFAISNQINSYQRVIHNKLFKHEPASPFGTMESDDTLQCMVHMLIILNQKTTRHYAPVLKLTVLMVGQVLPPLRGFHSECQCSLRSIGLRYWNVNNITHFNFCF